ncbi:hypothetical protein D3C84_746890 [compost metagenome]
MVDLGDDLSTLRRVGATDVPGQVLACAANRIELQFILSDPLLLRLIADFRAITQQQPQASEALHLQETAQCVIAVMQRQRLGRGLFEHGVQVLAVVAFGDNPQRYTAGSQQGGQIHFALVEERRQHFAIHPAHDQAIAHGAENRDGERNPAFAFLAPVQSCITGQRGLTKHLRAARAIDLHHAVLVLRHAGDQFGQQLIDDPQTLFRSVENEQRWQIALEPDQRLFGLRPRRGRHGGYQKHARHSAQCSSVPPQAVLDELRNQTLQLRWLRLCAVV